MPNPFIKGWKYLTTAMEQAIDENASPTVQIAQAVDAAKAQHQKVFDQAAVVAGNRNQVEMKLHRMQADRDRLEEQARQALAAADAAAASGDAAKAQDLQATAEVFASQLVAVEQQVEETTVSWKAAVAAADEAAKQVKESEARLKSTLAEAEQLRAQAAQAAMQETAMAADEKFQAFQMDDAVPTLDAVRAKIEARYANALGAQELVESTVGDQMTSIVAAGRDMKASARLEEIRAQLSKETAGELTAGVEKAADDAPVDAEVEDEN
ncbi:PspA/IM30 family protein [Corynebacterium sp. 13CS0277]|uniref:PspA/IM30 family protein n=1 Tax=Corynebacterium sp. 13CS0277 TaxID=2071994 RepID=UPI001304C265|nr:PspA/IM30 family protein [Corynebacterium sp. 13CS0277]